MFLEKSLSFFSIYQVFVWKILVRSYYCVKDGYLDVINPLLEIAQLSPTKTRTDHQRDNWPWSGISGKYFLQLTRTLDHERQQILGLKSVFLENDPESRTKKIFTYGEKESQGKQQNILWSGTLLENKQLYDADCVCVWFIWKLF